MAGLFRSKSLEKLSKLRNRLEHEYKIPEFEDVEVYYDLIAAFVGVIEGAIPAVLGLSEQTLSLASGGYIASEYHHDEPKITIEFEHYDSKIKESFEATISIDSDPVEQLKRFAFFLRTHLLLRQLYERVSSTKHVLKQLCR